MSRWFNPYPQFFDGNGVPLSNGTITFYAATTSTLQNIYTNVGLTVPATNPQPLDADGRQTQNIYVSTGNYRVVLKDSTGATIWDIDNYSVADTTEVAALIQQLEDDIANLSGTVMAVNYVVNGGMMLDLANTSATPLSLSVTYIDSVTNMQSAVLTSVTAGTVKYTTDQLDVSGTSMKYDSVSCGASGNPALRYNMASKDAVNLSGKTISVSMKVKHDVGSNVSYVINCYTPVVKDDFSSVTSLGLTSTTSVTSGTATTISVTGAAGTCTNGLQIIVLAQPGQALTTKNFWWSDFQITPTASVIPFQPRVWNDEYNMVAQALQTTDIGTQAQIEAGAATTAVATALNLKYYPGVAFARGRALDPSTTTTVASLSLVGSFNMTRVSKTGTGTYVFSTSATSSVNLIGLFTCRNPGVANGLIPTEDTATTSMIKIIVRGDGGVIQDADAINFAIFGDYS